MIAETEIGLADGGTLHVYDTGPTGRSDELAVVWHHGTPNIGPPPEPLLPLSAELGLRWVSFDRPGYGRSTRTRGRSIGSVAALVAQTADALGLERFATMGHSGGGPHALGCAALLPERVVAAVSGAGLAPFEASGLEWFAGMAEAGRGELEAAVRGPAALEELLTSSEFDPEVFTPRDHAALRGPWAWLNGVAAQGTAAGLGGMIDDDMAYVSLWGFEVTQITAPVFLLHGLQDRVVPPAHSRWLAAQLPRATLHLSRDDGHISVLNEGATALRWLRTQADSSQNSS